MRIIGVILGDAIFYAQEGNAVRVRLVYGLCGRQKAERGRQDITLMLSYEKGFKMRILNSVAFGCSVNRSE